MPAIMAATKQAALASPDAKDTSAGPGQNPAKAQPAPNSTAPVIKRLSMVSVAGTDNGARLPRRSAKSINETFSGIVGSVSNESVTDKPDDEIPF